MQQQSVFIQLPSVPMQTIYKTIQQVVQSNIPFFITGETGVGKEGIARYFTKPVRDEMNLSLPSIVDDSLLNSCKANSLDTKPERSQAQSDSGEVRFEMANGVSSFSMKFLKCLWTHRKCYSASWIQPHSHASVGMNS